MKPKTRRKAREWTAEYSGHSGCRTLYYIFEVPDSAEYLDTIHVREILRPARKG